MATTTVKTIGTGGDYSTIQAWEDACPSSLVTNDEIWQGQLKNQVFSGGAVMLSVAGITTDSTRYVHLTCEAGASFSDNASVQTNTLRYNESNGAAIKGTGGYLTTVYVGVNYTRLTGLQIQATSGISIGLHLEGSNCRAERCILDGNSLAGHITNYSILANCLVVNRSAGRILRLNIGAESYNCTFIALNGGTALTNSQYASASLINCAVFNVSAILDDGGSVTATTCYTSVGSPPTGFTTAAYSTSSGAMFENITSGTEDFRIKSGSALIDAGTTSATYGTPDIAGTARPSGSAYDVGCWEYVTVGSLVPNITFVGAENITATSADYRVTLDYA